MVYKVYIFFFTPTRFGYIWFHINRWDMFLSRQTYNEKLVSKLFMVTWETSLSALSLVNM